jgi:sterol desaturase/sphingolipid hydroxylase (fatty acid hydroxylase superfamily)
VTVVIASGNKTTSAENPGRSKKKQWHYRPEVPVLVSPLFRQPFSLRAVLKWFIGGWFPLSERLIILLISILSWFYFHPSLERCREFQFDWIAQIFTRNLVLMFLVAGGLHLYLYVFKRQADDRRYDARPLAKNSRVFTFNNQVLDNMFWTCASGVTIWSAYESLMMWGLANGYAPVLDWSESYGWIILMIFLVPIWETFYFYLIHRPLHWPPLYRLVHSLHHRNINVGPWSGLSMHPVEHLIFLGSVMIHWIIPANPLLIIFHLQYFTLSAATTHTGYEGLVSGGKKRLALGTFHHQMHHRYFECNYGGLEIPWDNLFGSFNDGTAESHRQFLDKRRLKAGKVHG